MSVLAIVGLILAFLNPVIGGVLVGYLVWLDDPNTGFQLIVLSFFMLSLYAIAYIAWSQQRIRKLENRLARLELERK